MAVYPNHLKTFMNTDLYVVAAMLKTTRAWPQRASTIASRRAA